jgi:uroporphyrinogen decarboxylase
MTAREKFVETMLFNGRKTKPPKWEFGYWGETLNNWYRFGLPKENPASIPATYTTPGASIYTRSWTCSNAFVKPGEYPKGWVTTAGALYWPTQGFGLDQDVKQFFSMDESQYIVDLNMLFEPMFELKVIEDTERSLTFLDLDGVERLFLKETATLASGFKWPIRDKKTWEELKHERLRPQDIKERFPKNWEEKVKEYKDRNYPLALGGYPIGYFGTTAHLMGYENLFYAYFDEPELIHDIQKTFTDLWISIFEEVLKDVEIDNLYIWEDISFGLGSMVSPPLMEEFMRPYYVKIIDFVKSKGVKIICVDTDGDCMNIIPFFISCGVNCMLPFESGCGMDVREVRKRFPNLAMMGGINKSNIRFGKNKIDEMLVIVEETLQHGGYVPFLDHFVPPDVDLENFKYYRGRLNEMIDGIK